MFIIFNTSELSMIIKDLQGSTLVGLTRENLSCSTPLQPTIHFSISKKWIENYQLDILSLHLIIFVRAKTRYADVLASLSHPHYLSLSLSLISLCLRLSRRGISFSLEKAKPIHEIEIFCFYRISTNLLILLK